MYKPRHREARANMKVLFHFCMTILTGGLWLVGLVIWRILK